MESTDMNTLRNRRKTLRYMAKEDATAVLGDRKGQIVDVSTGGVGFRFQGDDLFIDLDQDMDIVMDSDAFFLSGLPISSVTNCVLEEEVVKGKVTTKRCGIVFGELKPHQRFQLDYFIWLNSHAMA